MSKISTFIVIGIVVGCWCLSGFLTGFLEVNNDFSDNLFIAKHIDFHNLASLYNGFFPFGYNLLIKSLLPFGSIEVTAFFVNILAGLVVLIAVVVVSRWSVRRSWLWLVIVFVGFFPLFLHYITTPGSDPPAVAFFTIGTAILVHVLMNDHKSTNWIRYGFTAGLFLGAGALCRSHMLISSVLLIVTILVIRKNKDARTLAVFTFIGLTIVFFPQVLLSLLTGHGLLGNSQAFNVYKLVYGISWPHTASLKIPDSIFTIVLLDPSKFTLAYFSGFFRLVPYTIPIWICSFVFRARKSVFEFYLILSVFSTLYAVCICIGDSGRAPLLLIPWTMLSCAALCLWCIDKKAPVKYCGVILAGMIISLFFFKSINKVRDRICLYREYQAITRILISDGVTDGNQVFSTDYDLIFRPQFKHRFLTNGGWGRHDQFALETEEPEFNVEDIGVFMAECSRRRITHLILTSYSKEFSNNLYGIYMRNNIEKQVREIGTIGGRVIFAILQS